MTPGLSDESESVRDVAMRAGQTLINNYAYSSVDLLFPSLQRGAGSRERCEGRPCGVSSEGGLRAAGTARHWHAWSALSPGLFDDNWRIRFSSVQLLGDLLYRLSGATGKTQVRPAARVALLGCSPGTLPC